MQHFYTKLLCQKPMLLQKECALQKGPASNLSYLSENFASV